MTDEKAKTEKDDNKSEDSGVTRRRFLDVAVYSAPLLAPLFLNEARAQGTTVCTPNFCAPGTPCNPINCAPYRCQPYRCQPYADCAPYNCGPFQCAPQP